MNSDIPSYVAYINIALEPKLSYLSLKQHPAFIITPLMILVKIMPEKHSTISRIDIGIISRLYDL